MEKEKVRNVHGITTGVVTENWDADGKHPGMVKVQVFLEEENKTMTDWMQVAQPYAGRDRASLELDGSGGKAALKADIISLKARQRLQINGESETELTANASLRIQSCGILELKGSMIKIN